MTKPRRYERYSSEFKREAPLRASEEGISELGISTRQFQRWLGKDAFPGSGFSRDQEVAALKRELSQTGQDHFPAIPGRIGDVAITPETRHDGQVDL